MRTISTVGVAGLKGAGKSTVVCMLCEKFGFLEEAFAKPLKQMAYILNPRIKMPAVVHETEGIIAFVTDKYCSLQWLVDTYGWDVAKTHEEVRVFLQKLGTECVRELLHVDSWVLAMDDRLDLDNRFAIQDVRFENEVKYIQADGIVIWIDRPGLKSDGHASENEKLKKFCDHVVDNDGTIEELEKKILDILDMYSLVE